MAENLGHGKFPAAAGLQAHGERIPPSRGLFLTHNSRGKPFAPVDQKRWLRYNRLAFKTDKADILTSDISLTHMGELFEVADELRMALSLRTDCRPDPEHISTYVELGLHDVFLCPDDPEASKLDAWLDACAENGVPLRLQIAAPFKSDFAVHSHARRYGDAGVKMINLVLSDPFGKGHPARSAEQSRDSLKVMQHLASELESCDVETNILQVPFCVLDEEHIVRAANAQQRVLDHSQYTQASYELALSLYKRAPFMASQAILVLLARSSLHVQPVDNILLPWLIHRKYVHFWSRALRRVTRHISVSRAVPKERLNDETERYLEQKRETSEKDMAEACTRCALRRICDHESTAFRESLPGIELQSRAGELIVSPLHFCAGQAKYYDAIDKLRLVQKDEREALAGEAIRLTQSGPADHTLTSADYGVDDSHFDRMEGGIKWWSVSNAEKLSTPLGKLEPPFSVAVEIGGGIADFIGFSLGRHCKVMCPMEGYRHSLLLHVAQDGRYALLRDEKAVRPTVFEGRYMLPLRLCGVMEPRVSIWNIDESIVTQNVHIWKHGDRHQRDLSAIKYSIIIVCTRFSRRLHAVLRSIAHQNGFDLGQLEVIVAYVPGIDATEDLLDNIGLAYPDLRVVRAPFTEQDVSAKGFMINESRKMAAGEWLVLLDSDTLLPPYMLARIDTAAPHAEFMAPDGRKLLPEETTAKILMGELDPWDHWEELLSGPGDFRHRETRGIPVGFCQIVKAKYLKAYPYTESSHFENADMWFGEELRKRVGVEHRLSGVPVIHLDHGGSQWYGTLKHK